MSLGLTLDGKPFEGSVSAKFILVLPMVTPVGRGARNMLG